MRVALFEPEIPQNTGNIARTCAATNTPLFLIKPLGFSLTSRHMKRAGLDYWEQLDLTLIDDAPSFLEKNRPHLLCFSTKAKQIYTKKAYPKDVLLLFGAESRGLPDWVHTHYEECFVRLPMLEDTRSLNVSNAVAIALYEGLRQQPPPNLH